MAKTLGGLKGARGSVAKEVAGKSLRELMTEAAKHPELREALAALEE